jgi:site-specific DNA-methyltransferase (adenine-specific)
MAKNIHPTVKPLKLMSYLVTIGSRPGDTILDPFMGSGTTGVASKILHRNFIGFEIEGKYFEIAQQRIGNKIAKGDITEFEEDE